MLYRTKKATPAFLIEDSDWERAKRANKQIIGMYLFLTCSARQATRSLSGNTAWQSKLERVHLLGERGTPPPLLLGCD